MVGVKSVFLLYHGANLGAIHDITIRLEQLQAADDNYYIMTRCLLELANQAYDIFVSSEVEEKRKLIKLVLQNLRIEGENVLYNAHKPLVN